ncbi:MAG: plastocyanin/azurin family copper-binding protein [Candidatus Nanohaloarchaea archaeon]|nr:plastocyanin/azurin family copper-binding protein [Candidatus Nanohaloarchaea archaeon]
MVEKLTQGVEDMYSKVKNGVKTSLVGLAFAGLSLGLAPGCTSTSAETSNTEVQEPTETKDEDLPEKAKVEMEYSGGEFYYDSEIVHIEKGGTVKWVSERLSHTATAYTEENDYVLRVPEDAENWDSGYVNEGKSYKHTFEEEGVYDYLCIPHEGLAMVGTVVVGHPDTDYSDEPGLAKPQDSIPPRAREKIKELNKDVKDMLEED